MTEPAPASIPDAAARGRQANLVSMWVAIAALLVAAVIGAWFIIAGDQANIAGRVWLTFLLVALLAGATLLDARLGDGPNRWYLLVSTVTNVVIVTIGLIKLWNGWLQPSNTADGWVWTEQIFRWIGIVVALRLALFVTQLFALYFIRRTRRLATKATSIVTIVLLWATALVLAIPAAFPEPDWPDWWWRIAGATTLVAAVSLVIPIIIRAFDPEAKAERIARVTAANAAAAAQQAAWQAQRAAAFAQPGGYPTAPPAGHVYDPRLGGYVPMQPAAPTAPAAPIVPPTASTPPAPPAPPA